MFNFNEPNNQAGLDSPNTQMNRPRKRSVHHSYGSPIDARAKTQSMRWTQLGLRTPSPAKFYIMSPRAHHNSQGNEGIEMFRRADMNKQDPQQPLRQFVLPSPAFEPSKKPLMPISNLKQSQSSTLWRMSSDTKSSQLKQTLSTRCGFEREPRKQTSLNDFHILREIGVGKFSKVSVVVHKKIGFVAAMKTLPKSNIRDISLITQLLRQVKILSFVSHPNIVSLYGAYSDTENIYLIQELGCDGELYSILCRQKLFSEEATSFVMRSLLSAVAYLHSHKILHRDIKPENVVLMHGIVKLCDLGWSVHTANRFRETLCGTPLYSSPELLQGGKYTEKIDLWALGIMAYELRFGTGPFKIQSKSELHKIITDEIDFSSQPVSEDFQHFIRSLLQKNPKERLTADMMLRHPFILRYQAFETCQELCLPAV